VATPDLANDIAEQALEPISTASGDQSSTGRSVDELIQADQHLSAKRAARKPFRGIAVTQLLGGAALDDNGRTAGSFDRPGSY
jgi:hypothetical protein